MFELWCEHKKLVGNMSLAVAIASFIHLAFTFDLHYPKVRNYNPCHYNSLLINQVILH